MDLRKSVLTVAAVALSAAAGPAAAGQRVDERRRAAPDGLIEISNPTGSVKVVGWDRAEVQVTGTVGDDTDGVDVRESTSRTRIEVASRGHDRGSRSDIEVRVPAKSRVTVEGFSTEVSLAGVRGAVEVETVNGSIVVGEGPTDVAAGSVNGSVEVASSAARGVRVESVNGSVTVRGAAASEVVASTVNGRLDVTAGTLERGQLETVNGAVRFDGRLGPRATLHVETVSGSVELLLPAATAADFTVSTFSGGVLNEHGPEARRISRHTSEKELTFTIGGGGAKVTVETLSGQIAIRKR